MKFCVENNCEGVIQPQQILDYQGYRFVKQSECTHCKKIVKLVKEKEDEFKIKVDEFQKLAKMNFNDWNNNFNQIPEKLEEINVQYILQHMQPGREIIHMDVGLLNGQYDLLDRGDNSIAIEITQATNWQALRDQDFLDKKGHEYSSEMLQYDWIVNFNLEADISPNGRKKLELALKNIEDSVYEKQGAIEEINGSSYPFRSLEEIKKLSELGFPHCSGKQAISKATIRLYNSGQSVNPNPIAIFRIANLEASKKDNQQKLALATTDQKHLFIPIMEFNNDAAAYLQVMPKKQVFDIEYVAAQLNTTCVIPDVIDTVWVATARSFHASGKMGYRLAKITKDKDQYILEAVTDDIVCYI